MSFDHNSIELITPRRRHQVVAFLQKRGLALDEDVELTLGVYQDGQLIATGSLAGSVIKCIAVSCRYTGQGLSLKLLNALVNHALELGRRELFVFTRPANRAIFVNAGFTALAEVPDQVLLLENSRHRLRNYLSSLRETHYRDGAQIAGIVMNANPFTLGHRYLVEKAAEENDWVHLFVVRQDSSEFPYDVRLRLILDGLEHLSNVTVHAGSSYIISKATFPSYFIKEKGVINDAHARLDLTLFRNHIAPALGINRRYVGSEPYCPVTAHYNGVMHEVLTDPALTGPAIEVRGVNRYRREGEAISASRVRAWLREGALDKVALWVPESTCRYLQARYGDGADPMKSLPGNRPLPLSSPGAYRAV